MQLVPMTTYGFLRIGVSCPKIRVADPMFNTEQTLEMLRAAQESRADVVVFPECGLTGYTCGDLFHHRTLLGAAEAALSNLIAASIRTFHGLFAVGLPVLVDGMVFNTAAIVQGGKLLGLVPKTYLPNYKEFYDARYFAPAANAISKTVKFAGQVVPFGTDLLFACSTVPDFILGVEICEDLWSPIPPSALQAIAGATVLANLSASNETIAKAAYRRQLVAEQSGRCFAGYLYASSGVGESTTDLVFGGHCLIAENGTILRETERFQHESHLNLADLDLHRLTRDRALTNSFNDSRHNGGMLREYRRVAFELPAQVPGPELEADLMRTVDAHPFVPSDPSTLNERCQEILSIQVSALAKRLGHIGHPAVSIGVSGGLDSTLALVVVCMAFDLLKIPRARIQALTMPGFGTTSRTRGNAQTLMAALGVSAQEIDIRSQCFEQMQALGHAPFDISLTGQTLESLSGELRNLPPERRSDLTFENVQARMRTSLLMNTAFVIGTGDMSELALGWCTYNADHMSMYNPNVSVPKTLVRFLVRWAAENKFDGEVRRTLYDIAATPISPELLPTNAAGEALQATEASVGPYELVDFFLYHFLRWATPPQKILLLASKAQFDVAYTPAEIRHWLRMFLTRFFNNQFKRSCIPDGPKVGSVSLSPRGDWRMPSDAVARAWLEVA
jgi:NAD+ synthase (glutamine-hydrolysing)